MNLRNKSLILIAVFVSTVVLVPSVVLAQADFLLRNIDVAGTVTNAAGDTGTFTGTLSITEIDYNPARNVLSVAGVLDGVADIAGSTITVANQAFAQIPASLSPDEPGICDILFLDLGPIFLDVLGLTVELSQVVLDIDAAPGEGRLLGNLLCALTGLLDPANDGLLEGLTGLVNSLLNSLERLINELLGT